MFQIINFKIYNLQTNNYDSYIWDGFNAHRSVKYLQQKTSMPDAEVIFFSDICAGQQKNKFMLAL